MDAGDVFSGIATFIAFCALGLNLKTEKLRQQRENWDGFTESVGTRLRVKLTHFHEGIVLRAKSPSLSYGSEDNLFRDISEQLNDLCNCASLADRNEAVSEKSWERDLNLQRTNVDAAMESISDKSANGQTGPISADDREALVESLNAIHTCLDQKLLDLRKSICG